MNILVSSKIIFVELGEKICLSSDNKSYSFTIKVYALGKFILLNEKG